MATLFSGDINSFVKDMDSHVGWNRQTKEVRQRLFERLLDDYKIYGESAKLNEKYVKKQAGTTIIHFRFSLN